MPLPFEDVLESHPPLRQAANTGGTWASAAPCPELEAVTGAGMAAPGWPWLPWRQEAAAEGGHTLQSPGWCSKAPHPGQVCHCIAGLYFTNNHPGFGFFLSQNKENMDKPQFVFADREHHPSYSAGKAVHHCHPSTSVPSARVRCAFVLEGHNRHKGCQENAAPATPCNPASFQCVPVLGKGINALLQPCSSSSLCWRNPCIKGIPQIVQTRMQFSERHKLDIQLLQIY